MIHPTAIIDPDAKIADDCRIGPYCVVGAGVEIDSGCVLEPHVHLQGHTKIGCNNHFFSYAAIGGPPQHVAYRGEPTRLEIGQGNTVREYVSIHRGTVAGGECTRIGDHNFLMAYTHIAHDCQLGNHNIMANAASLGGHVILEDHVFLGGFTSVHQYVRIGRHSFSGAASMIDRDMLPYVMVAGNRAAAIKVNTIGLKRAHFEHRTIAALRQAFKILCRSSEGCERASLRASPLIEAFPEVGHMVNFIAASKRGIIRART